MKIGYEALAGELAGGITAWTAAGRPVTSTELLDAGWLNAAPLGGHTGGRTGARRVLDVRQRAEYAAGHVPTAVNLELGRLTDLTPGDPLPGPAPADGGDNPDSGRNGGAAAGTAGAGTGVVVMCGHGERAMTAASLLERAGHTGLAVVLGGPQDWAERTGQPLATDPPPTRQPAG